MEKGRTSPESSSRELDPLSHIAQPNSTSRGTALKTDIQDEIRERRSPLNQASFRRIYGIPSTVVALGLISVAMLIWTDRINKSQRMNSAVADALNDAQIRIATFHVWFEEGISGESEIDMDEIWGDLNRAMNLLEVIMNGGKSVHGLILEPLPLKDSNLRIHTEELKSLLIRFIDLGVLRLRDPNMGGIGSTLDQQFDAVFKELQDKAFILAAMIEESEKNAETKSRRIFFGLLVIWVCIVSAASIGLWTREAKRRQAEKSLAKAKDELEMKVMERTDKLRNVNDRLEIELQERRKAEEELRKSGERLHYLSGQLLTAQENEWRRISGELHDEFGQALASLKHRLYRIQKRVNPEETDLRRECGESLLEVGQITDNVRRFSRDLSPHVLEYCGLSVAIRSLIDDFVKCYHLDVTCDVTDIDHCISRDAHIVVYRIFQELLNNIAKHAQATQLSVITKRENGRITFFFEDNGKGFDVNQTILGSATGKGLGLAIMNERVRMLGGSLDLLSEAERGTRLSFTIPAK
jgi:signal transduction histidine kinase